MISLIKSLHLVAVGKIFQSLSQQPLHWALRVKDATRDLLTVAWLKPKLGCQGAAGTCQAAACCLSRAHPAERKGMLGHSKVTHWLHLSV